SYLATPWVAIFGLNVFSARATAALFGSLLPLIMLGLILKLTKNFPLAFITGLVIATSPWHIEVSRTAIEAGVALTVSMLSLYFLSYSSKKHHWIGLSLLIFSLFIYHTARLVAPFIVCLGLLTKTYKKSKLINLLISVIFIFGIFLSLTASQVRFKQISIFNDLGSNLIRQEAITEDGQFGFKPLWLTRVFHNKPLSWLNSFASSYLANTSLSYLFFGGAQPPRVTIPETGQFQILLLPFFIFGLISSIRKWTNFDKWLLLWLAVAPIPASLTSANNPHTYRTLFMLPAIAVFIAYGLIAVYDLLSQKDKKLVGLFVLGTVILLTANTAKTWHQYQVHQQIHQPWYREYGYKDLIDYLNSVKDKGKITLTNRGREPYIFLLFYNQILPCDFQTWPQKRLSHQAIDSGLTTWELFNYQFSEDPCPYNQTDTNSNNLYVVMSSCKLPAGFDRLKTINFMDGNPVFHIDSPKKQN
ncbi:hypothetical protein KKB06_05550, partial [Patescibacteria group bacterium]|nr:hypothetical protein [Patescibacteria group bacterium]